MREIDGELRGLLKKPNRPPAERKNRVVFDETRNEFFEADYIILIREDCSYDDEEESCTCGEHQLVRLCCQEECQCDFAIPTTEDIAKSKGSKFAPQMELVDEAALSPPDGYKDNSLAKTLGDTFNGHVFGAQHLQQLQVIQHLQHQRASMLAARNGKIRSISPAIPYKGCNQFQEQVLHCPRLQDDDSLDGESTVICTECAECAECAAKPENDSEFNSLKFPEQLTSLEVSRVAFLPLNSNSPEHRITQKEIIAGEERPKPCATSAVTGNAQKFLPVEEPNQRIIVETITMTTVAERRTIWEASEDNNNGNITGSINENKPVLQLCNEKPTSQDEINSLQISSPNEISLSGMSGILKGGKLWKRDSVPQISDKKPTLPEDVATSIKRSVHFDTQEMGDEHTEESKQYTTTHDVDNQINDLIPIKKNSTLFSNALRPNSAVRQLFPDSCNLSLLTSETLRAFDESKRAGGPEFTKNSDADLTRKSLERNTLRRSLMRKKTCTPEISLEERIRQLTCDIDGSPEAEEDEHSSRYINDMTTVYQEDKITRENQEDITHPCLDPNILAYSHMSGPSTSEVSGTQISDKFNTKPLEENISGTGHTPNMLNPSGCPRPAALVLAKDIQAANMRTQVHRIPPRVSDHKRPFLSTLAPLTSCVIGNKDDLSSIYTLTSQHSDQLTDLNSAQANINLNGNLLKPRKIAPDVLAGTPGQEKQDDLGKFAQTTTCHALKINKSMCNDTPITFSEGERQNHYDFDKRPSIRGINPVFNPSCEGAQQIQEQILQSHMDIQQALPQENKILFLPRHFPVSRQISVGTSHPNECQKSALNPHQQQNYTNQMSERAIDQHSEHNCWSFFTTRSPQQDRKSLDAVQSYYQSWPNGAMFRQPIEQCGHMDSYVCTPNCHESAGADQQHLNRCARSPTRRSESPPPLRNYHQMVFIPYNAKLPKPKSTGVEPSSTRLEHQNVVQYEQVTQQTLHIPIGYALPGMQFRVAVGREQTAQYVYTKSAHQTISDQKTELKTNVYLNQIAVPNTAETELAIKGTDQSHNSGGTIAFLRNLRHPENQAEPN